MAYCTLSELENQISEAALIDITYEVTGVDGEVPAVDEDIIDAAIADADAEIDAYLYGRYAVPLDPVPAIIAKISVDLTIYRLSGRRGLPVSDDRRANYEDSIRLLRDIQKGVATIGASTPTPSSDSGPISTSASTDRVFTMSSLTNY
jgi:phage gp36-like protein